MGSFAQVQAVTDSATCVGSDSVAAMKLVESVAWVSLPVIKRPLKQSHN